MRSLALLAPVLLAGCVTGDGPPIRGETPGHTCDAAGTDRFIGQPGTSESGAAILRATHSATLRWAPPGYALTMDFRADRVTVALDAGYKITGIHCG